MQQGPADSTHLLVACADVPLRLPRRPGWLPLDTVLLLSLLLAAPALSGLLLGDASTAAAADGSGSVLNSAQAEAAAVRTAAILS